MEEGRGTYNAPVRAVGEAAGQYCNCRKTECGPSKGFDSFKLAATARVNVSTKFVGVDKMPYREMIASP